MSEVKEIKDRCLKAIDKETQLEIAHSLAKDRPMEFYHRGRKEVWLVVHNMLVQNEVKD